MVWEPASSIPLVKLVWPPLRELVSKAVAPSLKMMVPVGVPAPGATGLTTAVKTTGWQETMGLVSEVRVTSVSALLTVCARAGELVLGLKWASALEIAVTEGEPATAKALVKVAVELVVPGLRVEAPRTLVPSLKVAVPVGMPAPGARAVMVAVKMTGWPATDGLTEEATVLVVAALLTV